MPSLSLLSLNHLHLPKCLRSLLNGDDFEFCGSDRQQCQDDDEDDYRNDGGRSSSFPHPAPTKTTTPHSDRSHRGGAFEEATERDVDDIETGVTTVKLVKTPGAILGLTVVGGVDKGDLEMEEDDDEIVFWLPFDYSN